MLFVAPSPTELQSRMNQKRFLDGRIRNVKLACIIYTDGAVGHAAISALYEGSHWLAARRAASRAEVDQSNEVE